ncbi:uncharacterized protein LOC117222726 isoform X2 [Megalopta genalis]|uniref:uncharacterized protein LOC117222726 isoform X2 n=1 Tax=Megalopta genalis TaxID=115081 RepID=UPI003FD012CC
MRSAFLLILVIAALSAVYGHAASSTSPENGELAVPRENFAIKGQLVRQRRSPLGKLALLGGAALLGKKALLVGGAAVGTKALIGAGIGAGIVGAGLYKAKYYGGGYGGGYGGAYGGSYGSSYSTQFSDHHYGWRR